VPSYIELEILLTTPLVPLVSETLTHHTLFRGLTTYHQMLCLGESPLTSAAFEVGRAARARTPVSEPQTSITHAENSQS
jgi:hypothetical protein